MITINTGTVKIPDGDGNFVPIPAIAAPQIDDTTASADHPWSGQKVAQELAGKQNTLIAGNRIEIAQDGKTISYAEKKVELIETINLSEDSAVFRDQEPDGTPYRFVLLIIDAVVQPDESKKWGVINCITDEERWGVTLGQIYGMIDTYEVHSVAMFKAGNGIVESLATEASSNRSAGNYIRCANRMYIRGNAITGISILSVLKAGSIINIYGVRA